MSIETKSSLIKCYAAVNRNSKQLEKSASGGVFSAIATTVLNNGGVVYGSAMQNDEKAILKVQHIRIDNSDELIKLQGSKYVKSSMEGVFEHVKADVESGKTVLFSGTPCQCAAVKLKHPNADNLILADLICHGTPSQELFTDYLNEIKGNNEVLSFSFRDKKSGWGLCAKIELKNGDKVFSKQIPCDISSYYKMFLRGETYQKGCYSCKFASKERVGDLTLGDYWGIEKIDLNFVDYINGGYDDSYNYIYYVSIPLELREWMFVFRKV